MQAVVKNRNLFRIRKSSHMANKNETYTKKKVSAEEGCCLWIISASFSAGHWHNNMLLRTLRFHRSLLSALAEDTIFMNGPISEQQKTGILSMNITIFYACSLKRAKRNWDVCFYRIMMLLAVAVSYHNSGSTTIHQSSLNAFSFGRLPAS